PAGRTENKAATIRFVLCPLFFVLRDLRITASCASIGLYDVEEVAMRAPIAPDVPLVDLHRHLDGNVRLVTVLDIARRHGIRLPADTIEELRPYVQVQSAVPRLMDFIAKFELYKQIFVDAETIERLAFENLEDAVAEGIDYIELRFSPAFMGERY